MLKSHSFIVLCLLVMSLGCESSSEVPTVILDSFASKFSNAQDVEWEKEDDAEWEAEFSIDGVSYSANFDLLGNWKETENEIAPSEFTLAINVTLNTSYLDFEVIKAEKSVTPERTVYEIKLRNGNKELEIILGEEGELFEQLELGNDGD